MKNGPPNHKAVVAAPVTKARRPTCPECKSGRWHACCGPFTDRLTCQDCGHKWVVSKGAE